MDVAATCPDAVVEAVGRGEAVRVGGGLADLPLGVLVAAPRIPDVPELRGARVAFTEARGSVSLFLRAALRARGLEPEDYETVVRGTTPAQAEALRRGDVDAAMLTPPFDMRLVAYRSLVVEDDAFASGVQLTPATLGNLLRLMREDGLAVPSDEPATYLEGSARPQLP